MKQWYVIYTRSRTEKKVANQLIELGIEAYCPTKKIKRKWSDRYKWVEEPIFRSYCFVKMGANERDLIYSIPGFVRFIFFNKKPAIVREDEMQTIQKFLNDFDKEEIIVKPFSLGENIKIESGVFSNYEGRVEKISSNQLTLYIPTLQVVLQINPRETLLNRI